jgi:hypothetical protein
MDLRAELSRYLRKIRENLHLDAALEKEIIQELETHVEDRCLEMQKSGLSEEEAMENSLQLLGSAKMVAHQIYEAHSQGTWRQALLAGMPHLFFAALFALNWLTGVTWVPVLLIVIAGVVFYGLLHSRPTWLFPWLGYALFPVAAAGASLFYLPKGWPWLTLIFYVPLVLWLCCFIIIKFIKRDWLYATLILVPVPTFVGWFLASGQGVFPDLKLSFLYDFAPWTGFTFLILGVSVALFVRLKNRWFRITALVIPGLMSAAVITLASNRLSFWAFLGLLLLMLSFVLVPAYIEHRVRQNNPVVTP